MKREIPGLIDVGSNPTVKIGDIRERRWALMDRGLSRRFCPVCNVLVPNIAQHCAEMADDDHLVQLIHGS